MGRQASNSPRLRWLLLAAVGTASCQTPVRRTISEAELLERRPGFLEEYGSELERIDAGSTARIATEKGEQAANPDGAAPVYDILLLSGGGAFGAFGVGFLTGWGEVTDPAMSRPQFDKVSGISTGALIAPFAFLGTEEAYETVTELYANPGRGWVRKRGIIPYLPGNVSLFDVSRLHSKIRSAISSDLVEAIGREASRHRQLIVGATNVDYGLLRAWDLAQIAASSTREVARNRIAEILMASAAIPGAFPPIVIDDFLYVDGGAALQMVVGLEDRGWLYTPDPELANGVEADEIIRIRIWMIVNQKLQPDPALVSPRWTSIGARSLSTLIRTSTLQSIQDAATFIQAVDAHPALDAELRYIAIPQEFVIPDSDEMFDADTMRALLQLGREMGANPSSWRTEPLRPGAPF